ncbi:MAG: hypothetical protein M3O85_08455 [Acidobacteriota bacterium]|nr:hypothetical protein [Acidobacteriota bacterium]
METEKVQKATSQDLKPKYEAPKVKVMDEAAVLTAFQVNASAATAWWSC